MSGPNGTATLTHKARNRMREQLKAIWDKRDVPHMPHQEFIRLTDRDLAYLLRFWAHKDRHWVEENDNVGYARQPDFTEEPPKGWAAMFEGATAAPATPTIRPGPIARSTKPYGRGLIASPVVFYGTGGGSLTPRQQMKVRVTNV